MSPHDLQKLHDLWSALVKGHNTAQELLPQTVFTPADRADLDAITTALPEAIAALDSLLTRYGDLQTTPPDPQLPTTGGQIP